MGRPCCCKYNIRHYLADGHTAWRKLWDGEPQSQAPYRRFLTGTPVHLAARSDGSVAVVGTRGASAIDLRVYAANGSLLWSRDVRTDTGLTVTPSFEYFVAHAVGCTATRVGVLWVVYRDGFGPSYGYSLYDADGTFLSAATIGSFTSGAVVQARGAVDGNGIFYGSVKHGVNSSPLGFSIDGAAVSVGGLGYNLAGLVIGIDLSLLANDVDVDESASPTWWLGAAFVSRVTLGAPSTLEWQLNRTTDQASRLASGDVVGAAGQPAIDGTTAQPIRVFSWADGALGATWPIDAPVTATWGGMVNRVRAMRPSAGAIASLGANVAGNTNVLRIADDGSTTWRHRHTANGFREFAAHADGAVTGVTIALESTHGDADFIAASDL